MTYKVELFWRYASSDQPSDLQVIVMPAIKCGRVTDRADALQPSQSLIVGSNSIVQNTQTAKVEPV